MILYTQVSIHIYQNTFQFESNIEPLTQSLQNHRETHFRIISRLPTYFHHSTPSGTPLAQKTPKKTKKNKKIKLQGKKNYKRNIKNIQK